MYDDSEVKAILKRAVEIDATPQQTSREELLRIAAEVGVSREAVQQAIAEHSRSTPATPVRAREPLRALRVLNLAAGGGILAGLISNTGFLSQMPLGLAPFVSLLFTGGLMMISGGLAFSSRRRSMLGFVRRNSGLWLGAFFGWSITYALLETGSVGVFPRLFFAGLTGGVLTTVVGVLFLAAAHSMANTNREGSDGDRPTGLLARVVATLRDTTAQLKRLVRRGTSHWQRSSVTIRVPGIRNGTQSAFYDVVEGDELA